MNKMLKEMTKEEYAQYRHEVYLRYRASRKAYAKRYYQKNKETILRKAEERYRKRCGL